MDRLTEKVKEGGLAVLVLVVSSRLLFQLTTAQDVAFISTASLCVNDTEAVPSAVRFSNVTNNSALIEWKRVSPIPSNDVQGYEILYWPITSTVYEEESVQGVLTEVATIHDLTPYTQYLVSVRLYCSENQFGLASPTIHFITEAIEPSAVVTNLYVSLIVSEEFAANISWKPLAAEDWNGIAYGYAVYIFRYSLESKCGGSAIDQQDIRVNRTVTSINTKLDNHCYRVNVFPINHKAWGPESDALYFIFNKLTVELTILPVEEIPQPTSAPSTPFLKSAYVYIIAVAVLAVVPIVIGIVLFKKSKEKKRKLQYCRGIHSPPYRNIQMYPLSPLSRSSAHASPHPPSSRVQTFSPMSNISPVTPSRPLLSSPMSGSEPPPREVTNLFAMPPVQSPTSPKFPQGISLGVEGGTSWSFTTEPAAGDVFVGSKPGQPGPGLGPHRPRANTEGGGVPLPNPYEHPVHPGGAATLPRADFSMRSNGGNHIPPPPSHAPPPLTQSSLEIFARASRSPPHTRNGHQNPQRPGAEHHHQGMSHSSRSTTHTGGFTNPISVSNSMRMIRSASQLHPVEENEQGPDYAVIDALPVDRHQPSRRVPHSPNHPPLTYVPNGSTRATRNSDDLSSFSDESVQLSVGQGQVPAPYYSPRQPETGIFRLGDQRESVFSETSTEEPSISSGSIREASPSGAPNWVGGSVDAADHKLKMRLSSSSSSTTPTNSRASHTQPHSPPVSPNSSSH